MPIRVYFDDAVADEAAIGSRLAVTSSTPTDGVCNRFSDSEVHVRPVAVLASRNGGTSAEFAIGRSRGRSGRPAAH